MAPSLSTVIGVCGVIPRRCRIPLNWWRCLSASAGTLLNRICCPVSLPA